MSRVAISEYAAKKLLAGDVYSGISIDSEERLAKLSLGTGEYVVKVDDGTKKRNKKGLIAFASGEEAVLVEVRRFLSLGYRRVLIEPRISHHAEDERYISCDLVRGGVSILASDVGGVDVEANQGETKKILISREDFFASVIPEFLNVDVSLLESLLGAMQKYNFSFVEINPYVVLDGEVVFLDAAVEVDSSKLHMLPKWVQEHVQNKQMQRDAEKRVAKLDSQSTASFSLIVFNEDASIFTLLSGGGASLVVLDSFVDNGLQAMVGNYGEYSGAPSREETKIYTDVLLSLLFASKAPKKVLVIAGGVANFTDVTTTFRGVVDSCSGYLEEFKKQDVLVRVRRGGPRQAEGLALLQAFFNEHAIDAIVSDASEPLSQVAIDAKTYLEKTS